VPEWERKKALPALKNLYDEIWIYGLSSFCDPLAGFALPPSIQRKIFYTGYLRRSSAPQTGHRLPEITKTPYLLVTPGGGGDGDGLIEWVLRAYETDATLPHPALLVLGPFMLPERRDEYLRRVARLRRLEAITFDANMEALEANALGVVSMGGYNTFCEILSLDKPSLIVPRTRPRMEQFIRTARAEALGLVRMLEDDGKYRPEVMARALHELPHQNRPSAVIIPGLLDGLINVNRRLMPLIDRDRRPLAQALRA
jgi:predicted glycosyltransferase